MSDSRRTRRSTVNHDCDRTGLSRFWLFLFTLCLSGSALPASLVDSAARIKPSVVGVGTFQQLRNPAAIFSGTGFVVADGHHVITNAHVLPRETNSAQNEMLAVLIPGVTDANVRTANVVAIDRTHDLALLRIAGEALPALKIGDSEKVREGQQLAFTGFPIGMALGLHPATHRATLAAIVPIARAGVTAKQLNARMIKRLRDSAYVVFQLDGTAYPGNSGSPLFDPTTAEVYGVINSVFVQGTREQVITRPSGITYAIPATHIRDLLEEANLAAVP